jgi:uncharacterized protein
MSKARKMYFNEEDCKFCNGMCCRYVLIEIEKEPRSKDRFDELIWWLFNPNILILKNGREWSILVLGKCVNLDENNRCRVYEHRPDPCRDYPPEEIGCHFNDLKNLDGIIFKNAKELLEYLAKTRKKEWAKIWLDKHIKCL